MRPRCRRRCGSAGRRPAAGLALQGQGVLLHERLERGHGPGDGTGHGAGGGDAGPDGQRREDRSRCRPCSTPTRCSPRSSRRARGPLVLTPHAGEFARIAGTARCAGLCRPHRGAVVKKGPVTEVAMRAGAQAGGDSAGSRSITAFSEVRSWPGAAAGTCWPGWWAPSWRRPRATASSPPAAGWSGTGRAADALARTRGQVAVTTTQLLDCLPAALLSGHQL